MGRLLCTGLVALAACGLVAACGPDPHELRYGDRLLPLVPGATWDYRTTDANGVPGARTLRVAGRQDGRLILESRQDGELLRSFLEVDALVLAVREEAEGPGGEGSVAYFEPGALRGLADANLREGEVFEHRWQQQHADGSLAGEVSATWTVEAVGRTMRLEAGIFRDVVRIRRTQSDGYEATLWYAPGIGLIRAEGAENLEIVHWALP